MTYPKYTLIRLLLLLPYLFLFIIKWTRGVSLNIEKLPAIIYIGMFISLLNLIDFKNANANFLITFLNVIFLLISIYLIFFLPSWFFNF